MHGGVGVELGVAVTVGVGEGETVGVALAIGVGVGVGVGVDLPPPPAAKAVVTAEVVAKSAIKMMLTVFLRSFIDETNNARRLSPDTFIGVSKILQDAMGSRDRRSVNAEPSRRVVSVTLILAAQVRPDSVLFAHDFELIELRCLRQFDISCQLPELGSLQSC
jgi:hypothetical protein